jgi:hypothetical protein
MEQRQAEGLEQTHFQGQVVHCSLKCEIPPPLSDMKTNTLCTCARVSGQTAALAGLVLVASLEISSAQPSPKRSPVGTTWDCVLSGRSQRGLALLEFDEDGSGLGGTFRVLKFTARIPKTNIVLSVVNTNLTEIGRDGTEIGRNGTSTPGSSTNNNPVAQSSGQTNYLFVFGASGGEGPWTYDDRGRVIGFFAEVIKGPNGSFTNPISLIGTAVAGKRIVMTGYTSLGKISLVGIPQKTTLPNISGRWYGYKKVSSLLSIDFFDLDPTAVPNMYTLTGEGPGVALAGEAFLSSWKRMAFVVNTTPDGGGTNVLSATVGSFVANRRGTNVVTRGIEAPNSALSFKATWQRPPLVAPGD